MGDAVLAVGALVAFVLLAFGVAWLTAVWIGEPLNGWLHSPRRGRR